MNTQTPLAPDAEDFDVHPYVTDKRLEKKIAEIDWTTFEHKLTRDGFAILPAMLAPGQCRQLADYFTQDERFRSHIVMARHAFGRGEYKYFANPLPDVVAQLRNTLYPHLAPIANRWHELMRIDERFPATLRQFHAVCREAGQTRPTPLLLRYHAYDYCCLHRDLYGEHVFPFQAIFLLDEPGRDFTGGELLLTESDPKKPGRAEVVPLRQGDAVVLAVNCRPVRSARGYYRAHFRHGVSELRSGNRHTLGVIFHDAK